MSIVNPQHPCILKERTFHVAHASFVRIIGPHIHTQTHGLRTPNEAFIHQKSQTFGLGQTIWADKFWGTWLGYFRLIHQPQHPF